MLQCLRSHFGAVFVATIGVCILQVLVVLTLCCLWTRSSACRQQHRLCGCCVLMQCEQVGYYSCAVAGQSGLSSTLKHSLC
jgi:hypothetical protein